MRPLVSIVPGSLPARWFAPIARRLSTAWPRTRMAFGWVAAGLVGPIVFAPVSAAAPSDFDWPLRPRPAVVRAFDKPERNWLPGHRGVDLAGSPGQQVFAAGGGTIAFVGTVAGKQVLSIDHPGGLRTTYEPVNSSIPLGRRVDRGTPVGTLERGHDGCPVSACLHWGVRRTHDYLDPLGLIHRTPIRLKPLEAN